jgi:hypothetical protein
MPPSPVSIGPFSAQDYTEPTFKKQLLGDVEKITGFFRKTQFLLEDCLDKHWASVYTLIKH